MPGMYDLFSGAKKYLKEKPSASGSMTILNLGKPDSADKSASTMGGVTAQPQPDTSGRGQQLGADATAQPVGSGGDYNTGAGADGVVQPMKTVGYVHEGERVLSANASQAIPDDVFGELSKQADAGKLDINKLRSALNMSPTQEFYTGTGDKPAQALSNTSGTVGAKQAGAIASGQQGIAGVGNTGGMGGTSGTGGTGQTGVAGMGSGTTGGASAMLNPDARLTPPAAQPTPADQNTSALNYLQNQMNGNNPAIANTANTTMNNLNAQEQWQGLGKAQTNAQNPNLTSGGAQALANQQAAQSSAATANAAGTIANAAETAQNAAANTLATQSLATKTESDNNTNAVNTLAENILNDSNNYSIALANSALGVLQYNETVKNDGTQDDWNNYNAAINAHNWTVAASIYNKITGQTLDTSTLETAYNSTLLNTVMGDMTGDVAAGMSAEGAWGDLLAKKLVTTDQHDSFITNYNDMVAHNDTNTQIEITTRAAYANYSTTQQNNILSQYQNTDGTTPTWSDFVNDMVDVAQGGVDGLIKISTTGASAPVTIPDPQNPNNRISITPSFSVAATDTLVTIDGTGKLVSSTNSAGTNLSSYNGQYIQISTINGASGTDIYGKAYTLPAGTYKVVNSTVGGYTITSLVDANNPSAAPIQVGTTQTIAAATKYDTSNYGMMHNGSNVTDDGLINNATGTANINLVNGERVTFADGSAGLVGKNGRQIVSANSNITYTVKVVGQSKWLIPDGGGAPIALTAPSYADVQYITVMGKGYWIKNAHAASQSDLQYSTDGVQWTNGAPPQG